jgi:hypothetical protein
MKDLKLWIEKQIKNFGDPSDEFTKGNKWGHECVLSKLNALLPKYCIDCSNCETNNDEWWCTLNGEDVTGNEICTDFEGA